MSMFSNLLTHASKLPLSDAAAVFASGGVPVFPCVAGGKRQLTAHGFRDATTSLDQVSEWWGWWPGANIGIPTGASSGVEVVDVDVHVAGSGFPALRRAKRAGLVSGWEALVGSPSGGLHLYFPTDPAHSQSSWQAATAHIDFRGTGGYIIAPPSRVTLPDGTTGAYVLRSVGVAPARPVDARALREFLDPRPPVAERSGAVRGVDAARLARWVTTLSEGERNHGLFWAACRMVEAGSSPTDTLAVLGPAAEEVGLGAREVSATIRSAYRTTHSNPTNAASAVDCPDRPRTPVSSGRVLA